MLYRFHLAIEGGDLKKTIPFYVDILGCKTDMCEEGLWQDIDFWGHELTLHTSVPRTALSNDRHDVDMGAVIVPHFGVHLPYNIYTTVKENIKSTVGFVDQPYTRFAGTDYQQETFFVHDPNFNVLEIKSMSKDNSCG